MSTGVMVAAFLAMWGTTRFVGVVASELRSHRRRWGSRPRFGRLS
jgi:hypothetical protein